MIKRVFCIGNGESRKDFDKYIHSYHNSRFILHIQIIKKFNL